MRPSWQNGTMTEAAAPFPHDYALAVHRLAAMVPEGAALSYGDLAELLGSGGARQAGKAMASAPPETPWWRILRSNGSIADPLMERARQHWAGEGLAQPGKRVDMNKHRWQPEARDWARIDSLRQALGNSKMSEADDQL